MMQLRIAAWWRQQILPLQLSPKPPHMLLSSEMVCYVIGVPAVQHCPARAHPLIGMQVPQWQRRSPRPRIRLHKSIPSPSSGLRRTRPPLLFSGRPERCIFFAAFIINTRFCTASPSRPRTDLLLTPLSQRRRLELRSRFRRKSALRRRAGALGLLPRTTTVGRSSAGAAAGQRRAGA